jgi:hypothetical protein
MGRLRSRSGSSSGYGQSGSSSGNATKPPNGINFGQGQVDVARHVVDTQSWMVFS